MESLAPAMEMLRAMGHGAQPIGASALLYPRPQPGAAGAEGSAGTGASDTPAVGAVRASTVKGRESAAQRTELAAGT